MKLVAQLLSWQKLLFIVVLGVVLFQNRLSGLEYLSGWDNLHPEVNFELETYRALSAGWQEFRGLGHLGGMGHAADLPRTLVLWVLHFFIPSNYLRWMWHMGMLALGPIGVWYLTKRLFRWNESASLASSTFYLLNLATVQYFYTPYESFSGFYGFLPWLIAVFIQYLEVGKKRDLFRLLGVSFLATTAFYVQTLFIVYALLLGLISLHYLKRSFKRVSVGWLVILMTNAFWLLPVIYFVITSGGVVGQSKINSIASPETAYMNAAMGNWRDVAMLKGFWVEYVEWGGSEWGRLLGSWVTWINTNFVENLAFGFTALSCLGLILGVVKRRVSLWAILALGLAYFMLASSNPPLGFIYTWLTQSVPLFGEMFRSVFTKWSVVMALFVAIGAGILVEVSVKRRWLASLIMLLIIGFSSYISWPVFRGHLISDSMKVEIPSEYTALYSFFKNQDKGGRVAYLPSAWMWGWQYHDWGYRGSGFLWYGIEQPILDRAFDVWSSYNETFYQEFSSALYGAQAKDVERVLAQYDVRYILLDESVITPGQDKALLRLPETKRLMRMLGANEVFHQGFLTVWDLGKRGSQFVSAPSSYTWADGAVSYGRNDVIYAEQGTYVSLGDAQHQTYYPFAQLMREEVKGVRYADNLITVSAELSSRIVSGSELAIPSFKQGEHVQLIYHNGWEPAYRINGQLGPRLQSTEIGTTMWAVVGEPVVIAQKTLSGNIWREYLEDQRFTLESEVVDVEVPAAPFVYDFAKIGKTEIKNCDILGRGSAEKDGATFRVSGRGAACDYISMSDLSTKVDYFMRIQGENTAGLSVKQYLYNGGSQRNDLEYLLGSGVFDQTFVMLPWSFPGSYTLNVTTRSFGQFAQNKLLPVEVYYFPLSAIARARVVRAEPVRMQSSLHVLEVRKIGTWLYRVKAEGSGLLKLSQGYDEGWVSFGLPHVKVDGWANGWMIPQSGVATIFYWPQLLEYLGFGLLGLTFILILRRRS